MSNHIVGLARLDKATKTRIARQMDVLARGAQADEMLLDGNPATRCAGARILGELKAPASDALDRVAKATQTTRRGTALARRSRPSRPRTPTRIGQLRTDRISRYSSRVYVLRVIVCPSADVPICTIVLSPSNFSSAPTMPAVPVLTGLAVKSV